MRVKLLTRLASPDREHRPGDILDLDERSALSLLDAGSAVRVGTETASVDPGEKAIRPRGRPRKVR